MVNQNKTKKARAVDLHGILCSRHPWESLFDFHVIYVAPFLQLKFFPEDSVFSFDAEKQMTS